MSGFTKLHSSIVLSTVWREPNHIRIVWVTMLALADAQGRVEASLPGLADIARVSLEECQEALERFKQPDQYSRSKEHEGRRVEECDGGWRLLTYAKHREARDQERRREQLREAQARFRAKNKQKRNQVSQGKPKSAQAEAEADKNTPLPPKGGKPSRSSSRRKPRTAMVSDWQVPPELVTWCQEQQLSDQQIKSERDGFVDFWISDGGLKADWPATYRNRVRSGIQSGRIKPTGASQSSSDDSADLFDAEDAERIYGTPEAQA